MTTWKWRARQMLSRHMDNGLGFSLGDDSVVLLQSKLRAAPSTVLELFDEDFRQLNELEVIEAPVPLIRQGSIWRGKRTNRVIRITWSTPTRVGVSFKVEDRYSRTMSERTPESIRQHYVEA